MSVVDEDSDFNTCLHTVYIIYNFSIIGLHFTDIGILA